MKKVLLILIFISLSVNSQNFSENELFGIWKVEKIEKKPVAPEFAILLDGFTNSTFNFDANHKFELKTTINSEIFSMVTEMTNGKSWIFDKNSNHIKIGSSNDNYSIMGIFVKKENNKIYFNLEESGIIFLMTKTKIEREIENIEEKLVIERKNIVIDNTELKMIKIEESDIHPFDLIENIPITSECNPKWKKEKLFKCVQKSIIMHVNRKFNADLASTLGLAPKIHKIITTFIIYKNGEIVNINSTGSHPSLNNEATRVISSLPNMKPGIKDGKPINVRYTLPIQFKVE